MADAQVERDAARIPCEQCQTRPGAEPHECAAVRHECDTEPVICNCCEACQERCRTTRHDAGRSWSCPWV